MAGIALPDHVFAGDADPIVPPPVQTRKVLARLPHARLTVVPDAGHLLPLEAAGAVTGAVREMAESGREARLRTG